MQQVKGINSFEGEVLERLGRMEGLLTMSHKAIYGNGQPGLLERCNLLDKRITSLEEYHRTHGRGLGLVAQVVAWLVTTTIAVVAGLMH